MEKPLSDKDIVIAVILSFYMYDEMNPRIFDEIRTLKIDNIIEQLVTMDKEEYCKAVVKAAEYLKSLGIELVEKRCGVK